MPYIQPNSTIYLYNNIELDNSYKDTLYFSGIEEQNQYFNVTKPWKYAFVQQMYQRTNKGTLRIEKNAEFLYDCNYMRFTNPRTVNGVTNAKWYYAFITNWEYINENVTEITYEIDIMQTYFFDVIIEPSFVVRQHEATDPLYGNVIEESLNIGTDYVSSGDERNFTLVLDSIVCFSTKGNYDGNIGNPRPTIINNVPANIFVTPFENRGSDPLSTVLQRFVTWATQNLSGSTEVAEGVMSTYLLPAEICRLVPDAATIPIESGTTPTSYVGNDYTPTLFNIGAVPTSFGSYTPHNKKLYTYPYSYLNLSNHFGDSIDYKYELFANPSSIAFEVIGALMPTPAYMCTPENYRGISRDYDSSMVITDFPTVPVTIDGFQQWLTHNSGKMTASAVSAVIGLFAAGATLGMTPVLGTWTAGKTSVPMAYSLAGGYLSDPQFHAGIAGQMSIKRAGQDFVHNLSGFSSNVASLVGEYEDAQKLPNGVKGNVLGNGLLQSIGRYEFRAYKMQIKEQEARKIDTFFDMFGYAQNRVTDVNRNVRPVYTYTKTEGCSIIQNQVGNFNSGATSQVISDMQKIYDNGITFWKPYSGFRIGDYSETARLANAV